MKSLFEDVIMKLDLQSDIISDIISIRHICMEAEEADKSGTTEPQKTAPNTASTSQQKKEEPAKPATQAQVDTNKKQDNVQSSQQKQAPKSTEQPKQEKSTQSSGPSGEVSKQDKPAGTGATGTTSASKPSDAGTGATGTNKEEQSDTASQLKTEVQKLVQYASSKCNEYLKKIANKLNKDTITVKTIGLDSGNPIKSDDLKNALEKCMELNSNLNNDNGKKELSVLLTKLKAYMNTILLKNLI